MKDCLFCILQENADRPILAGCGSFFAVEDKYPVSAGHTLLVPVRHVDRLRDLTAEEFLDLRQILGMVQDQLTKKGAEGFNIGVNEGEVAGQTLVHLHVHVIPRYAGDVETPRGGIRNLKTALVEY